MRQGDIAFVGRQPILDADGNVYGYDLLFRDSADATQACIENPIQATAQVLVDVFGSFGASGILGSAIGFIHADPDLRICDSIDVLPTERLVVGIPALEKISAELVGRVKELHHKGVYLCLDNFEYKDARIELLPYVHYARVCVSDQSVMGLRNIMRKLSSSGVMTIAGRVETREQHATAKKLGFDLCQGYFFARPDVLLKPRLVTRRSQLLDLITRIEEATPIEVIAKWIRDIPLLGINLLNLARCVSICPSAEIESLDQAIVMIGQKQLRHWLNLLLYASEGTEGVNNPLCAMAAGRGKAMEGLAKFRAQRLGAESHDPDRASLTGILSLAPALFDIGVDDLVANLSVHSEVKAALLHREGWLGQLLELQEAIDRDDVCAAEHLLDELDLTQRELQTCQIEAILWANNLEPVSNVDVPQDRARKQDLKERKEGDRLDKRLRNLYPAIEIDDKALQDLIALRESTMNKAELALKRVEATASNVASRRQVGGLPRHLSIFKICFAGTGRMYYSRGRERRFRLLAVGAKDTENQDMKYLSQLT